MKSLHRSIETPPDIVPASLFSGTFQLARTTTSTGTSSSATNDVLYIKHSVALTGLNKLETQSINPDIAELDNVFYNTFNLNKWGIAGMNFTSPKIQYRNMQCAYLKIIISSLDFLLLSLCLLTSPL